MEIYRSTLHGFLLFSPVSLTELCSFWYGLKDLFTLHKLADDVTRVRKDVDLYGRLWAVQGRNPAQISAIAICIKYFKLMDLQ